MVLDYLKNKNFNEGVLKELGLINLSNPQLVSSILEKEQDLFKWLDDSMLTDDLVYKVRNKKSKKNSPHICLNKLDKIILTSPYSDLEKLSNNDDYFILGEKDKSLVYYIDLTKVDELLYDDIIE